MALTRRNFVRAAGLAGAAGSVALLAGCARGAADSGANEPAAAGAAGAGVGPDGVSQVVITMTPSSEPAAGFDPLVGWGAGEHVHEPLIQSTLIATDNNLAFVNDLATDYGCSEDGLTWTFHIREDVMFTDGVPLTAEDVAFTINGIVNGEAAEADLSMVDEARAVDATTCEIAMKRPNNALLYTLAVVGIVPAHAYGPDYGEHPIGSGRYMLEQWDRGQQVILRANPDYYGDAPLMDRVVVLFMEEDASLAAAQSGTADVAYTSAALAGAVPAGYTLLNCASVDSRGISLPCNPAGTDVTVEYKSEHSELAALLAAGQADIAVLPQPFVTSVLTQNPDVRIALDLTEEWDKVTEDGSKLTMGALVVRKDFAESNPEAVEAFLKEYQASTEYVTDEANLDDAAALIEKYGIIAANVAKQALPYCNIVCITGEEMKTAAEGFLSILAEANPSSVGGALPAEDFYYLGA